METAAAPAAAARSASPVTATAAPPAATTAAATAASTAAAQERSRLETAHRGRATWCSRAKTAASTPPAAVSHRTRETERETRKLNGGCSVVGGPSGVSTGRQKPVRYGLATISQVFVLRVPRWSIARRAKRNASDARLFFLLFSKAPGVWGLVRGLVLAVTSVIQSPTRLRISGPWGDVVEAQCQLRTPC